jgi:hypothetical protein
METIEAAFRGGFYCLGSTFSTVQVLALPRAHIYRLVDDINPAPLLAKRLQNSKKNTPTRQPLCYHLQT